MTDPAPAISAPDRTSVPALSRPCPGCGYDLRATTGDRCPECGLAVDAEAMNVSGVPWAHRSRVGLLAAFARTATLVVRNSPQLQHEPNRPQDPRDAAAFHRGTGLLVALAFLSLLGAVVAAKGLAPFAITPSQAWGPGPQRPRWVEDLLVPWSAGATLAPVLPLALIGLALHLAGVQRTVFRTAGPPDRRRAAVALASYASAPLVLLLPPAVGFAAVYLSLADQMADDAGLRAIVAGAGLVAGAVAAGAVVLTFVQVGNWLARTTNRRARGVVAGLAELAALWLIGAVLYLGVLPWCVGLVWVLIDAAR